MIWLSMETILTGNYVLPLLPKYYIIKWTGTVLIIGNKLANWKANGPITAGYSNNNHFQNRGIPHRLVATSSNQGQKT